MCALLLLIFRVNEFVYLLSSKLITFEMLLLLLVVVVVVVVALMVLVA